MTSLKILAATLGLLAAAGTLGTASAQTSPAAKAPITAPMTTKTVGTATDRKTATIRHHRAHLARHGIKHLTAAHSGAKHMTVAHSGARHIKFARETTTRARIAHKLGLKHVAKANIARKTTVVR